MPCCCGATGSRTCDFVGANPSNPCNTTRAQDGCWDLACAAIDGPTPFSSLICLPVCPPIMPPPCLHSFSHHPLHWPACAGTNSPSLGHNPMLASQQTPVCWPSWLPSSCEHALQHIYDTWEPVQGSRMSLDCSYNSSLTVPRRSMQFASSPNCYIKCTSKSLQSIYINVFTAEQDQQRWLWLLPPACEGLSFKWKAFHLYPTFLPCWNLEGPKWSPIQTWRESRLAQL